MVSVEALRALRRALRSFPPGVKLAFCIGVLAGTLSRTSGKVNERLLGSVYHAKVLQHILICIYIFIHTYKDECFFSISYLQATFAIATCLETLGGIHGKCCLSLWISVVSKRQQQPLFLFLQSQEDFYEGELKQLLQP